MTKWKALKSKADYKAALRRINELMDVKRNDAVHNELNLLSFLVQQYEEAFHPMPDASPHEVLRFAMEMKGIKNQDLIPLLGTKGNVSKILSGKANLQLEDVHPLSEFLGIPLEALIPKYPVNAEIGEWMAGYVEEPQSKSKVPAKKKKVKPYNKKR